MDEDYRWFRQDELVRKCITSNAFFATQQGFETAVEADDPNKYEFVKENVDELNKAVNMDLALFVAQVKRSVHGKAGFEVVVNSKEQPTGLLSLQSTKLFSAFCSPHLYRYSMYTLSVSSQYYPPTTPVAYNGSFMSGSWSISW